ncbi:MAG: hypothetical protein KA149_08990 [Chitinophagales bacterium]|nr:hypothetical protein [Chitinophagales bacterium]
MKTLITILMFCSLSLTASARDWYRIYLIQQSQAPAKFQRYYKGAPMCGVPFTYLLPWQRPEVSLPAWERPKGAIFCRMEDYLTAKTKVWFKVGVK